MSQPQQQQRFGSNDAVSYELWASWLLFSSDIFYHLWLLVLFRLFSCLKWERKQLLACLSAFAVRVLDFGTFLNVELKNYGSSVNCNKTSLLHLDVRSHFRSSSNVGEAQFQLRVVFNTSLCIYLYLKTEVMMMMISLSK